MCVNQDADVSMSVLHRDRQRSASLEIWNTGIDFRLRKQQLHDLLVTI